METVTSYRDDELGPRNYDRDLYRERTINRLKRFRLVATRYDQLATAIWRW